MFVVFQFLCWVMDYILKHQKSIAIEKHLISFLKELMTTSPIVSPSEMKGMNSLIALYVAKDCWDGWCSWSMIKWPRYMHSDIWNPPLNIFVFFKRNVLIKKIVNNFLSIISNSPSILYFIKMVQSGF